MRPLLLLALLAVPLLAQNPAPTTTFTKVSTTTLQASAGTITCRFVNSIPNVSVGIQISCSTATASVNSTAVLPVGNGSGYTSQLNSDGNAVSWQFTMPAADGIVSYQITLNGQNNTGTF